MLPASTPPARGQGAVRGAGTSANPMKQQTQARAGRARTAQQVVQGAAPSGDAYLVRALLLHEGGGHEAQGHNALGWAPRGPSAPLAQERQ